MEHELHLRQPLPRRPQPDYTIKPSAEQVALVHWITAQMLRLLTNYIFLTGQNTIFASDAPLHLFELSDQLCCMLALENGCVVLFDLLDVSPKLIWSDDDCGVLRRLPVAPLRRGLRELSMYAPGPCSFVRLTE